MSEADSTQPTPSRGVSDPAALDAVIKAFTSCPPDPGEVATRERATELTMGAVVACYRRDLPVMTAQLEALAAVDRYGAAFQYAADRLVAIANDGIPPASLRPEFILKPNIEQPSAIVADEEIREWASAVDSVADLLTGHATGNLGLSERGKSALRGENDRALLVLTVLVHTAVLRLDRYASWQSEGGYYLLEWQELQAAADKQTGRAE